MKATIKTVCIAAAIACANFTAGAADAAAAPAPGKTGIVNMAELIRLDSDYPRDVKAVSEKRAEFEEELTAMQSELETLGESLRKQAESLQTPNPMLNPAVREDARKKFEADNKRFATRRQQFLMKTQEAEKVLAELRSMLAARAAEKVRENLSKFAAANGYAILLDADTVAWARDGADLTEEVLKFAGIDPVAARAAAKEAEDAARRRAAETLPASPAPLD